MKSLKRISKIQTKIKTVLTQMISVGVVALIGLFLIEAPASAFSGSGAGTQASPYQITNATQLQEMQDDLDAHYVLADDIDCSDTVDWNDGAGFKPVGGFYPEFTGTFDGQNHNITGLYINRPGQNYVGLFFYVNGSNIRNVGLEEVNVRGRHCVGGLVGSTWFGTITNSYATGSVTGYGYVGGLVGTNNGTVSNSYSTGSVTGNWSSGGLVGENNKTISNSYSTGNVTGYYMAGGLVGQSYGPIINSYSTGSVTGKANLGGLVGHNYYGGAITNSYSTGSVTGSYSVGGLVGVNWSGTITSSYWDIDTSGQGGSAGGEGKTTEEMMGQSTFVGWDFVNLWGIDEGVSYPYLLWQIPIVDTTPPEITYPADIIVEQESGDGTVVEFECTATDNVDPNPIVICEPPSGSTFPLGTTTVNCQAIDASGNNSTCTFTVTVVDTTPPEIACSVNPEVLWPPNHRMVPVIVLIEAEDICTETHLLEVSVTVTSSEPDDDKGDGAFTGDVDGQDGFTAPVPVICVFDEEAGCFVCSFDLRAERDGRGDDRTYTITAKVKDASGNETTVSCEVTVPHDQGKGKGKK